jgi:hypothetical protein
VLALERENDVSEFVAGASADGSLSKRDKLIDQANALATTTDVLLVGGTTLTAAAALLFFLRAPDGGADIDEAQLSLPRITLSKHAAFIDIRYAF